MPNKLQRVRLSTDIHAIWVYKGQLIRDTRRNWQEIMGLIKTFKGHNFLIPTAQRIWISKL